MVRVWREPKRARLVASGQFVGAFGAIIVLVLGYFAAHGALHAMGDIVVGANSYYVTHETNIHTLRDVLAQCWEFLHIYNPVASALLVALVALLGHAIGHGDRETRNRLLFSCVLLLAAFLAVAMQKKFYLLHWIVFIGPVAVASANLAERSIALAKRAHVGAFLGGLVVAYATSDGPALYANETKATIGYLGGHVSRQDFARSFDLAPVDRHYDDSEAAGEWIRDHSDPQDFVAVRGFEPGRFMRSRIGDIRGVSSGRLFSRHPHAHTTGAEWLAEGQRRASREIRHATS